MKIDKEKVLELYNNGLSDNKIAVQMGVNRERIRYWRKINQLQPNKTIHYNVVDYSKVLEFYKKGFSDQEIADSMDIHHMTVFKWRRSNKLRANYGLWRGDSSIVKNYTPKDNDKPWKDPESLFCDTKFLESLFGKSIKKCECGSNA